MPRDDSQTGLPAVPSDHWDGKRFFNPHADTDKSLRDLWRLYKARGPRWTPPPPVEPRVPPVLTPGKGEVAVTFIGHVTFLIQVGGATFLTDPVFSDRAGPFGRLGPKRARAPGVRMEDLPPVDAILLSHNHYDHLDTPSLRHLARRRGVAQAITGLGNGPSLRRAGFEAVNELDWWDGLKGHRAPASPSYRPSIGRRAAPSTDAGPCGAASWWKRRASRSISQGTAAIAHTSGKSASVSAPSTWPCCPSAPMSRAGS